MKHHDNKSAWQQPACASYWDSLERGLDAVEEASEPALQIERANAARNLQCEWKWPAGVRECKAREDVAYSTQRRSPSSDGPWEIGTASDVDLLRARLERRRRNRTLVAWTVRGLLWGAGLAAVIFFASAY